MIVLINKSNWFFFSWEKVWILKLVFLLEQTLEEKQIFLPNGMTKNKYGTYVCTHSPCRISHSLALEKKQPQTRK